LQKYAQRKKHKITIFKARDFREGLVKKLFGLAIPFFPADLKVKT
jgi:hypothetical protein